MNEYLGVTMDEAYHLLTTHRSPWPKGFTTAKKLQLVDKFVEYYQSTEEYERCAELMKLRERINRSHILKTKRDAKKK
jgi:hypothetical protein